VDSLSFKASTKEPTQAKATLVNPGFMDRGTGPVVHVSEMSRRAVGEIVVIGVTPGTATGLIVFSMEPVHVGDRVEVDQQ
jgi:hypothetical protein